MKVGIGIFALLVLFTSPVFAHSGRTNSEGCHTNNKTGQYHCHRNKGPQIESPSSIKDEAYFNKLLTIALRAKGETSHSYFWQAGSSSIRVDIETDDFVIEGGLDKRSSLDSLQQALFASKLTGKKPAVVIYDTDGVEGRFEFRIKEAAKKAGVVFKRLNESEIRSLSKFP